MPKYKLVSGNIVDEQQLVDFAASKNLTLEELLSKNPGIEIVQDESFQIDPIAEVAAVGSTTKPQAAVMDSVSENISSESPKADKGFFENTWDSLVASTYDWIGSKVDQFSIVRENKAMLAANISDLIFGTNAADQLNNMSYEERNKVINAVSDISDRAGILSIGGSGTEKVYENFKEKATNLRKTLNTYDQSITEDFLSGNFARGTARATTEAISSIPSIAESMAPLGILSIALGAASEASKEAQKEGEDLDLTTLAYSTTVGASEGLLELVTRRIGGKMFKDLLDKPKAVINKTVKETFLDMAKDFGAEGLSESGTLLVNKAAESIILGREDVFNDSFTEFVDTFIVGGFAGGGMTATGSGSQILRQTVQGKQIKKQLAQTPYENLSDAYKLPDVPPGLVALTENSATEKFLETDLKQKVNSGEMTTDEADAIRINFRNTQGTINRLKAIGFAESDYSKAIELAKEKKELQDKIKEVGDPVLTEKEKARIEEIDNELRQILSGKKLEANLAGTTATAEKLGFTESLQILSDEEFLEERAKRLSKDKDIDIQEARKQIQEEAKEAVEKGEGTATGFFTSDGEILINKDAALEVGDIGVGSHELLHPILNAIVGDATQQGKLVADFEALLAKNNPKMKAKMDELLKAYEVDGVLDPNIKATEYLTVFSSAIQNGDIKYSESVFAKIGDYILNILRSLGFENANFNSAKGVYNFLKEYNNTISSAEGLSDRAIKLIKDAETARGVKVSEAGAVKTDQASKKLAPEVSTQVAEQITEIKNLQKEGEALAKRFNKEFIKSPKQIRIEQQLSENIAPALDALAESTTKRLYDPIAPDAKRSVSRQDYKDALKANWTSMVINEFDPAKQDVETFLSTRGNLRANSLAKELGIEGITEGGIKADVTEQKALTTEDATEVGIDEGIEITRREAKLINPVNLIPDENLREKYRNTVKEKVKNLNTKGLSFKTLKDQAPEVTAELFGIPVKKVTDAAANLSTGDLSAIQNFINKNADTLLKLLPEGGIDQNQAASESLLGTSTGVPKKLLDAFYDPKPRGTKGAGLAIQNKRKGITRKEFLETFGIVDGKKLEGLSPRGPQAQAMKGMISLFGRMMTNTVVRQELSQQSGTEAAIQDIAAGKSDQQFSRRNKKILDDFGIGGLYYKLDSEENLDRYVKDFETNLLPVFGPNFFKPSQVVPLGSIPYNLGNLKERKKIQENYEKKIREAIQNYTGAAVNWKIEGNTNSPFERLSFYKPSKAYGITPKQIAKNFKNGRIAKYNEKYNSIFTEMWVKTAEAVRENPAIAPALMIYYQAAANNAAHPHRLGAEMIGYSSDPKGIKDISAKGNKFDRNYIYEHAVQSVVAYETLMRAAMDKNVNFESVLFDVKQNYKLIALDAALNKKLDEAGFASKMPANWKSWLDRYFNEKVADIDGGINPETILDADGITFAEKYNVTNKGPLSKDQFSKKQKKLSKEFNNILENKTGIPSNKEIDAAKAEVVGANKGRFNWFIPPTAEDFVGLLYQFLGKGAVGDKQMAWFKVNLLNPYAKAMSAISRDRTSLARNYRALKKELKIVPKNLKKEIPGEGYTVEQGVRVYIWTKQGYDIPGINKKDAKALRDYVNANPELKEFADKLIVLNKNEYAKPKDGWTAGTLTTDMLTSLNEGGREKHLAEWQANVDVIFSEQNLNKIEAAYGKTFRNALENSLTRMKTGRNRTYGTDNLTGRFTDWLTNSVGAIMFFNTRSAILQTISASNFINFSDNNPIKAAGAFANQKQYWSDFIKLWNSDFLVDRRDGLRLNVNESDIADMAKKGGVRGVISELLKLGFTPTQLADSFAIAAGGSTFYRNRVKTYLKQGLDQNAAEKKAFQDFRETAEESQQSSRPDKISQEQAGPLGRIILAFANTPAQYARLMKKAFLDLKNGRGDAKTNISKLIYYGAVQNLVFTAMQQALFGIMFGDEEEDEENQKILNIMSDEEFEKYKKTVSPENIRAVIKQRKIDVDKKKALEKKLAKEQNKATNVANGMADSILRGMGIYGAIISVLKNTTKKIIERSEYKNPNYSTEAIFELLKISPPISSKATKIRNALRSYEWDKDKMYEKGLALENPAYLAAGNIISAATNIPLDRVVKKVTNIKNSLNEELETWQRIALLGGWADWEIGAKTEKTAAEIKLEEEQKELELLKNMTSQEKANYLLEKKRKARLEREKNKNK
jgi:hypothetical protein